MNSLHIIGNLCSEVELRTTTSGKEVATFSVAVNKRKTQQNPDPGADFFRISAWNEKATLCKKFLQKGKKVSVVGPVSVSVYTNSQGEARANLEVMANEIEFLSPKDNIVNDPDDPFAGR